MSIVSGQVEQVGQTNMIVFAGITTTGSNRVVVGYNNQVLLGDGKKPVGIILPICTNDPDDIHIGLDINCSASVDDVETIRHTADTYATTKTSSSLSTEEDKKHTLQIWTMGAYQVSLAKSTHDLVRVDALTFIVDEEVRDLILARYPTGHAFIICQLTKSAKFHSFFYEYIPSCKHTLVLPTYHFRSKPVPAIVSEPAVEPPKPESKKRMTRSMSALAQQQQQQKRAKLMVETKRADKKKRVESHVFVDNWNHRIHVFSSRPVTQVGLQGNDAAPRFCHPNEAVVKNTMSYSQANVTMTDEGVLIRILRKWNLQHMATTVRYLTDISARGHCYNGDVVIELEKPAASSSSSSSSSSASFL